MGFREVDLGGGLWRETWVAAYRIFHFACRENFRKNFFVFFWKIFFAAGNFLGKNSGEKL
jgi:hypothetical protein